MTKLERFEYAKNVMKWTCDKDGNVLNKKNRKVGYVDDKGYLSSSIKINKKSKSVRLHQYVYWYFNHTFPEAIDHINRIKIDNSIDNLRSVTCQQNQFNTNVRGYHFHKLLRKYRACIRIDKKQVILGDFETEDDARNAYLEAKKIYHKI